MVRRMLFVLAGCVAFAMCAQAEVKSGSAEGQIQIQLDDMQSAANAHDTDRYMSHLQHGDRLTFVYNGTVIQGWDSLRAQQLKWWQNGKSDVVYTPLGVAQFQVLAPTVVVVTQTLRSSRTLPSGEVGENEFVVSTVWQRLPEGWRVVYSHESTVH